MAYAHALEIIIHAKAEGTLNEIFKIDTGDDLYVLLRDKKTFTSVMTTVRRCKLEDSPA